MRNSKKSVGNQADLFNLRFLEQLFDKRVSINLNEFARAIGRTEKAVYHMIDRGQVRAVKRNGRWLFTPYEVGKWIQQGGDIYAS